MKAEEAKAISEANKPFRNLPDQQKPTVDQYLETFVYPFIFGAAKDGRMSVEIDDDDGQGLRREFGFGRSEIWKELRAKGYKTMDQGLTYIVSWK